MELDQLNKRFKNIIEPLCHRECTIKIWSESEANITIRASIINKGYLHYMQIVVLKDFISDIDDSVDWIKIEAENIGMNFVKTIQNQENHETK